MSIPTLAIAPELVTAQVDEIAFFNAWATAPDYQPLHDNSAG
jgi:hypothetical protein